MFVLFCTQKWSWSFSKPATGTRWTLSRGRARGLSNNPKAYQHIIQYCRGQRRRSCSTSSEELGGTTDDTHRDSKAKPQSYFCKGSTGVVWNCSTKSPGASVIYHVRHRSEYISHISVTLVNRYNQSCLLISFQELLFCKIMLFFTTH